MFRRRTYRSFGSRVSIFGLSLVLQTLLVATILSLFMTVTVHWTYALLSTLGVLSFFLYIRNAASNLKAGLLNPSEETTRRLRDDLIVIAFVAVTAALLLFSAYVESIISTGQTFRFPDRATGLTAVIIRAATMFVVGLGVTDTLFPQKSFGFWQRIRERFGRWGIVATLALVGICVMNFGFYSRGIILPFYSWARDLAMIALGFCYSQFRLTLFRSK